MTSLYARIRAHGTLTGKPEEMPDAVFALPSNLNAGNAQIRIGFRLAGGGSGRRQRLPRQPRPSRASLISHVRHRSRKLRVDLSRAQMVLARCRRLTFSKPSVHGRHSQARLKRFLPPNVLTVVVSFARLNPDWQRGLL